MSLKSSVQRLRNQQADQEAIKQDRQGFIAQWRSDVAEVYGWFEEALKPFIDDGAAQVHRAPTTVSEEALGDYEIDFLIVVVLGRRILLVPQARITVGGTGRLDLFKESRPSADNRLLVLRGTAEMDHHPTQWLIQDPPKRVSIIEQAMMQPARMFETKRSFSSLHEHTIQNGIDYVLNL